MKKEWNSPRIETLDVRLTLSGEEYNSSEGFFIPRDEAGNFVPEDGYEVGPTPS